HLRRRADGFELLSGYLAAVTVRDREQFTGCVRYFEARCELVLGFRKAFTPDFSPVQHQAHLVARGVRPHRHRPPDMIRPRPALELVGPRPGTDAFERSLGGRALHQQLERAVAPEDVAVQPLGLAPAENIDLAATRLKGGVVPQEDRERP